MPPRSPAAPRRGKRTASAGKASKASASATRRRPGSPAAPAAAACKVVDEKELFCTFELTENVTGVMMRDGRTVRLYAVLNEAARSKFPNIGALDAHLSCDRDEEAPTGLVRIMMTIGGRSPGRYKSLQHPQLFYYDVLIHTFYNCYAGVSDSAIQASGVPPSVLRGLGRRLLCAGFGALLEHDLVKPSDVVMLEADGAGPGARSAANPDDRRPLVEYYRRSFGLEPLDPLPVGAIEHYVPMATTIGTVVGACARGA
jgi:hypothetical protein